MASQTTVSGLKQQVDACAASNQTMHIGTTALAINRASANQTLTGVSIDGNATGLSGTPNITVGTVSPSGNILNTYNTTIYGTASAYGAASVFRLKYNSDSVGNGNGAVYVSAGDISIKAQGLNWAIAESTEPKGAEIYLESGKSPNAGIVHGAIHLRTGGTTRTVGDTRLYVDGGGSIGIGTLSPSTLLDVRGTVRGNAFSLSGTTVVDGSRNLTNIGTIGSGAITCTTINTQNNNINAGTGTVTAATFSGNATSANNATTAGGLSVHAGRNNEANKIVRTDGNGYILAGWINTTSGDNGNTTPSRFYSSHDEYIRYHTRNTFKMHLGLTAKYDRGRVQDTADTNYWTGAMGWGTTDWNTVATWGSGFVDSWSSPGNRPSDGQSHHVGIQTFHYTAGVNNAYGWQMVGGPSATWSVRHAWGTWSAWYTLLHSGNYNSYSPTLTGGNASGTWGINISGNAASVTNGVYTSGNQTIGGNKTFTSTMILSNLAHLEFQGTAWGTSIWFQTYEGVVGAWTYNQKRNNLAIHLVNNTVQGFDAPPPLKAYMTFSITGNNNNGSIICHVQLVQQSDDRLKSEETRIQNATETLLKLRPQLYKKHTDIGYDPAVDKGVLEAGLIAQEVYYAAPELRHLVNIPDDATPSDVPPEQPDPDNPSVDPDYSTWGSKPAGISYLELIPYIIASIQEKDAEIKQLRADLEHMKALFAQHVNNSVSHN